MNAAPGQPNRSRYLSDSCTTDPDTLNFFEPAQLL